jgi:hypothetical protein
MNYDDAGVTTAGTSKQASLGGEEYEVESEGRCRLCVLVLDGDDLRNLGIPSGTETVVVRFEQGMILASPAQ